MNKKQKKMNKKRYRTPLFPLKPGTLKVRWAGAPGAEEIKTVDSSGVLADADCIITVNQRGVVRIRRR